jgi:hypothetical protein
MLFKKICKNIVRKNLIGEQKWRKYESWVVSLRCGQWCELKMKKKNGEKLGEVGDFLASHGDICDGVAEVRSERSGAAAEVGEMSAVAEEEIWKQLVDLLDRNFDGKVGEVCKYITSGAGVNCVLDRMIDALYQRFDAFAENYPEICGQISMCCIRNRQINDGHWDRFRAMFNTVKSRYSARILENLRTLLDEDANLGQEWSEEEINTLHALEKDVVKWDVQQV